jgi:predicted phosphoribosyltransferase
MQTITSRPPARGTFANRRQAGVVLAARLVPFQHRTDVTVLALPRGGVPVGYEVARALHAPLDVFVVRKLGLPQHPELAMGALASGAIRVLNEDVLRWYAVTPEALEIVTAAEQRELARREQQYRGGRAPAPIAGRVAILVDDGLATGATMRAAVMAVRMLRPSRIVVAAPVGSRDACIALEREADDVICALLPDPLTSVGAWYVDFSETTDAEIRALLAAPADVPRQGV